MFSRYFRNQDQLPDQCIDRTCCKGLCLTPLSWPVLPNNLPPAHTLHWTPEWLFLYPFSNSESPDTVLLPFPLVYLLQTLSTKLENGSSSTPFPIQNPLTQSCSHSLYSPWANSEIGLIFGVLRAERWRKVSWYQMKEQHPPFNFLLVGSLISCTLSLYRGLKLCVSKMADFQNIGN